MGKGSAPSAPDPYQSAGAQFQYGTQAAAYNKALGNTNTVGPTGSTTYQQTGTGAYGAPEYTQTTTLNPQQQQILNEQEANSIASGQTAGSVAGQAQKNLESPITGFSTSVAPTSVQGQINTSGVSAIPGANDLSGFTQQAQDASYKNQTQYLDPQFSQGQEQLDAQLRNSGAQPGSTAYDNAMLNFNNQKQQAYQSADNNAVQQGLAEQQALYGEGANTNQQEFGQAAAEQQGANSAAGQQFGQELEGAGFGNQASTALRDLPLNEYDALEGGLGTSGPSFGLGGSGGSGSGGVSAPDIMSAFNNQYAGQLANYNAGVSTTNAGIGALSSLAALALLA